MQYVLFIIKPIVRAKLSIRYCQQSRLIGKRLNTFDGLLGPIDLSVT